MSTWARHFQDVSAGRNTSTASFGGVYEECQFTGDETLLDKAKALATGETAKRYQAPAIIGVLVGVLAKTSGMFGAAPIVLGLMAAGGTLAAQDYLKTHPEKV